MGAQPMIAYFLCSPRTSRSGSFTGKNLIFPTCSASSFHTGGLAPVARHTYVGIVSSSVSTNTRPLIQSLSSEVPTFEHVESGATSHSLRFMKSQVLAGVDSLLNQKAHSVSGSPSGTSIRHGESAGASSSKGTGFPLRATPQAAEASQPTLPVSFPPMVGEK